MKGHTKANLAIVVGVAASLYSKTKGSKYTDEQRDRDQAKDESLWNSYFLEVELMPKPGSVFHKLQYSDQESLLTADLDFFENHTFRRDALEYNIEEKSSSGKIYASFGMIGPSDKYAIEKLKEDIEFLEKYSPRGDYEVVKAVVVNKGPHQKDSLFKKPTKTITVLQKIKGSSNKIFYHRDNDQTIEFAEKLGWIDENPPHPILVEYREGIDVDLRTLRLIQNASASIAAEDAIRYLKGLGYTVIEQDDE